MRRLLLALALFLGTSTVTALAQPNAAVATADARSEIAAALYAASATQAAAERVADARIRAQQTEINRLQTQGASARAALAAAQERFVAEIVEKDRAYAQEIAVFRSAVTDIASTPEGAQALAKFNAGDEIGALAILDRIRAARDAARQTRANLESAAEGRRIATLALEARERGKLDTQATLLRWRDVVRLDPSVPWDWIELCRLYRSAGLSTEAARAVQEAVRTANNDRRATSVAMIELGDLWSDRGHLDNAQQAYEQALALDRAAANAAASPSRDVSVTLSRLGDVRLGRGDAAGALEVYREAFNIDRETARTNPSGFAYLDICIDANDATDASVALGDLSVAKQFAESAVMMCVALAQDGMALAELHLAYARWRRANILAASGDLQAAAADLKLVGDFATAALTADPTNKQLGVQILGLALGFADVQRLSGNNDAALKILREAIERAADQASSLEHYASVYGWLAELRLAVISGDAGAWERLAPGWPKAMATADLSAMDFVYVRQLQASSSQQ